MANYKVVDADQLDADLASVADSIRAKAGTTDQMAFPDGFKSAVEGIQTGGSEKLPNADDTYFGDTVTPKEAYVISGSSINRIISSGQQVAGIKTLLKPNEAAQALDEYYNHPAESLKW